MKYLRIEEIFLRTIKSLTATSQSYKEYNPNNISIWIKVILVAEYLNYCDSDVSYLFP